MNDAILVELADGNTREEITDGSPIQDGAYWLEEIRIAKDCHREWLDASKRISEEYAGGRRNRMAGGSMNILWSNISTMQPALYQRLPNPVVERRWKQKDPVSRAVAEVMQRACRYSLEDSFAHIEFCHIRDDYLISGLGVPRVIYEATIEEPVEEGQEPVISMQSVRIKHWPYKDFLTSPEEMWPHKRWIAYRHWMDKTAFIEKFSEKLAVGMTFGRMDDDSPLEDRTMFNRAEVWEIWDKRTREVIWVSENHQMKRIGDKVEDPYGLRNFYPSPRPVMVIETTDNTVPVPEYCLYEDQAKEIHRLTRRIYRLADKIKAVGAYAGEHGAEISKMLDQEDGMLVAVTDWAARQESGGLKAMIEWAPINEMVSVLLALYQAREAAKADLYEVSGISDIVRGQGDSAETATAQRIKGQFATLRLDERKRQFATMIADTVSIMAELIAEHFQPEFLAAITDLDFITEEDRAMTAAQIGQQMMMAMEMQDQEAAAVAEAQLAELKEQVSWDQIMDVLQNDYRRSFKIRVETEDTIEVDRQADKEARVEFLTAFVQLMQAVVPMVSSGIMPFEVAKEVIMFSVRGFSQARELEDLLDDIEAPQAPDPGPSKEEVRMQIAQLQAQVKLLLQAKDHEFRAAEGEKDRMVEIAQMQLSSAESQALAERKAQEADKDRALQIMEHNAQRQHKSVEAMAQRMSEAEQRERDRQVMQAQIAAKAQQAGG